jgi:hypothetical protein
MITDEYQTLWSPLLQRFAGGAPARAREVTAPHVTRERDHQCYKVSAREWISLEFCVAIRS